MKRLAVTVDAGVAHVRLNRPDKMNALDDAAFEELIAAGEGLKRDAAVRAVVLSGAGRAFCAGLDTSNFAAMAGAEGVTGPPPNTPRTHGISNRGQHAAMVWRDVPAPVIAAVHGTALGAGLQLALGADIRYVTPDARLGLLEIRWGLIPDMAGIPLLRALARQDVVRELAYSGRIFSGTEALAYGFATRVVDDPLAEALAFAHEVAGRNPEAIQAAKRVLNEAEDSDAATLLQRESVEQDRLVGSPNQVEAVNAAMEKRAARFTDPGAAR
ncbi:crotonase/enoyl-CoA hydratase family protein [Zavarzinia sp. CC-PAN008]|uniref:crotonase/enoyl-CoA hydratase family protein n=1 Tax=Zavarzinia sp. CC-PAN008 TaxID=3243332 RepID=UPI003F744FF6